MKDIKLKVFASFVFVFFALFIMHGKLIAGIIPGFEFAQEVDSRNSSYDMVIGGFNTTTNGLAILTANGNYANVKVDGIIGANGVGVYAEAGSRETNPPTTGFVSLNVERINGRTQGFSISALTEGSTGALTCSGVESSNGRGGYVSAIGGGVELRIYGNCQGATTGLALETTNPGTIDAVVTGAISGNDSVSIDYGASNRAKLIVWKLEKGNNGSYITNTGYADESDIERFAKGILYIINSNTDESILLLKPDGSILDESHGYPVAKEGDRVVITTSLLGVSVTKAFNNGVEITTKNADGNFYIDVPRGGGIFISIETTAIAPKLPNPMTLKGRTFSVRATAISKKAKTVKIAKAVKITKAQGVLSYRKASGNRKITINKKTGLITIKKGLKKGSYKIAVKVTAAGNDSYKSLTSKVAFTVRIK